MMTDKQKQELIAKILDNDYKLTDEEVKIIEHAINDDEDFRISYEFATIIKASACKSRQHKPDWEYVKNKIGIKPKTKFHFKLTKQGIVASITVLLMISAAAVSFYKTNNESAINASKDITQDTVTKITEQQMPLIFNPEKSEDQIFENTRLEDFLDFVSKHYGCKYVISNESAANLRLYITVPANAKLEDIIELLNTFDAITASLEDNTIIIK